MNHKRREGPPGGEHDRGKANGKERLAERFLVIPFGKKVDASNYVHPEYDYRDHGPTKISFQDLKIKVGGFKTAPKRPAIGIGLPEKRRMLKSSPL